MKKCFAQGMQKLIFSFLYYFLGSAYAWGMGNNLQLGTGDEDDVYQPKKMKSKQLEDKKVLKISAGGQHSIMLAHSDDKNNN